jgi:chemotaxis protein MotB
MLEEEKASIEAEIGRVRSEYRTLLAELREEVATREAQKAELETEISQLKSTYEAEVSDLSAEIDARDTRTEELETELGDYRSQIVFLQERLGEDMARVEDLREDLTAIHEDKESIERRQVALNAAYRALREGLGQEMDEREVFAGIDKTGSLKITFVDRILFKSGSAAVTPEGKKVLQKVGVILKDVEDQRIRVVGHTDDLPIAVKFRDKYPTNWELSSARAAAVVRFFQHRSRIDPEAMEAVGSSFYQPIASNDTEEGRAQNRRVEIVIAPRVKLVEPAG